VSDVMAIPKSITIHECIIPIKLVDHLFRDHNKYGEYSSMDMIIYLDKSMSMQKKEIILCHEIVEAVCDIYLLEMEETEKQAMAVLIYDIVKMGKLKFG
jgi:hypothetical protein